MPAILLLPPGTYNLPVPQSGDWGHFAGFETLKTLADGLQAADQVKSSLADLISIPDVWAQVQLVESALRDEKHSLHARVVGEWRGLLGLLALAGQRSFPITVQPLDLDSIRPSGTDDGRKGPSFGAVLHALMPQGRLAADGDWNNLSLILYRDRPVGLMVPNTLVCPIRDYADALDEATSFRDGGRLIDPCLSPALVSEDFHVIARMLGSLDDGLRREPGDAPLKAAIAQQLQSFRTGCVRRAGEEVAHGRISQQALHLPTLHRIFNPFRTLSLISGSGEFATCLPPRSEFASQLKGAIIVDPSLPTFLGSNAETIRIWDRYTLSQWLRQPELHETIRRSAAEAGYLVLTAEDLFTPTLCQLEKDTVSSHPKAAENLVLPLTALALLFLSPAKLAEKVAAERTGINAVTLSLSLDVRTAAGVQKSLTLRRSYSLTDRTMVKTLNTTRLVAWPNFTRPDWKRHFLYHAGNSSVDVYPQACFTLASAREVLGGMQPTLVSAARTTLAGRLAQQQDKKRFPDEMTRFNRGGMFKLSDPVEAVICTHGEQKLPVGLILFPALKEVPGMHQPAEIGIDFGTTNTIVYARFGEGAARSLAFEDRHVTPYAAELSEDDRAIIGMDFLPTYRPTVPFMTLLRQRNLLDHKTVREVILTDRIFYLFDVNRPLTELALEQAPNRTGATDHSIRVDLKWGRGRGEEIRLFLTQVVLQTLAEVANAGGSLNGVTWRISHPLAFNDLHRQAFEGVMNRAVSEALGDNEPTGAVKRSVPESLAAAYYFAGRKVDDALAQFSDNVITIDVGGGTTDISLWQEKKLIWQGSVMLAGRNLLIDFLLNDLGRANRDGTAQDTLFAAMTRTNPAIHAVAKSIKDYMTSGGANVVAGLEMFVNHPQFSAAFRNPLADYIDNKSFQRLAAIADLSLAGILYYVAGMVRTLTDRELFTNDNHTTFICLGGRGSLLFKTMIGDQQRQRIAALFREAAGLRQNVNFVFSEQPKEEVACGLLFAADVENELIVNADAVVRDFIIGERVKVDQQELSPGTDMRQLPVTGSWRIDDNGELKNFVKIAAPGLKRAIDLPSTLFDRVRDTVNGDLSNRRVMFIAEMKGGMAADAGSEGLQPPFIIGLRALIAEISARGIDLPLRG